MPAGEAALLLRVTEQTDGAASSATSFPSGLARAGENSSVREKCAVLSGFVGGGPAAACAPQLGAAAGSGHGAGLRGLRHGRGTAAESATHDFNAQRDSGGPGPGGARQRRGGDQNVSRQMSRTEDQRQGVRVPEGHYSVQPG